MPVYDPDKEDHHVSPDPGRNPGEQHEKNLESKFDSKALNAKTLRNSEESKNAGWYSAFKNEDNGHSKSDTGSSKFGDRKVVGIGGEEPGWKPSGGDQVGKGFTGGKKPGDGDKQKTSGWMHKNRKRLVVFSIMSILLGGAGAGTVGTASGPFQIIHAGEELRGFHLKRQEDQGDSRFVQLARYVRSPNKPQNLRLGIAASKYADRIEKNMNKNGVKSTYTEKFGYLNGYEIDKSKFKGGQFNDLAGKSDAEVTKYFKDRFNVDVTTRDGRLFIDANKIGYLNNLRFNRALNEGAGYSKITAAVRARIMGQKAGISWHPMTKLDKKVLTTAEARYKAWQEKRDARIKNGVSGDAITTSNDADKEDKAANQNASDAQGAADDIAENAKAGNADATSSKITDIMKGAGGATAAVGLTCLVHGIAVNIDDIQESQVVKPAIRVGMEFVTMANQIMFGGENNSDLDPEQIGYLAGKMHDPKTGYDFFNAKSIQAENGEKAVGPDVDATMKPGGENPIVALFGNIPGLDTVCPVVTSTGGQIVTFGISFIGGPVSAIVTEGIFRLVGPPVISAISHFLAGDAIDPKTLIGAPLGGVANYGVKYFARGEATSAGGQELNGTETVSYKNAQKQADTAEFQEHSLAYRLFNPYDHRTLVASFLDKQQPSASGNIAALAKGFLNFGSSIISTPKNLFASKVDAATSDEVYDYGFKDAGFSQAEMDNQEIQDPYKNACIVVGSEKADCKDSNYPGILQSDQAEDYIKDAEKCFGIALDQNGGVTSTADTPTTKDLKDQECHDKTLDWLRIRFYIFDTQLMDGNACYNGDDESCNNVNFNGGAAFVPGLKDNLGATA